MKHTIFLLHGMGNHTGDWAKEQGYLDAIKQVYGQYEILAKKPIEDRFEFVPVSYDHIFADIVKIWADNAKMISALAAETGAPVGKLVNWLKGAGELNSNFAWSHAADVLLYRGFRLVREAVCTNVANQIITVVNKQHTEFGKSSWSVVAHSLGTAVIHDTLARIGAPNKDWPGNLAFSSTNEQAKVVMMVANVSKVLEVKTVDEPYDAYGQKDASGNFLTTVAPGFSGQLGRECLYYVNIRHKLDPFTIPKMFNPLDWPDHAAALAKPPRYVYNEVEHIHDANVHDFAHYFKHPDVHVPFFQRLITPDIISPEEYKEARDKFSNFGGLGDAAALKIRKKLLDNLPAGASDWVDLGAIFKQFLN